MPKRKVAEDLSADGSDLSPPPNDLEDGAVALAADADLQDEVQPAKKRRTAARALKQDHKSEAKGEVASPTQKKNTRTRKAAEVKEDYPGSPTNEATPKRRQRKTTEAKKVVKEEDVASEEEGVKPAPKGRKAKKPAAKQESEDEEKAVAKPAKNKRKTKEEKEAEAMPLAARTVGHKLFIGAHVSSAGGQYLRMQLDSIYTSTIYISSSFNLN